MCRYAYGFSMDFADIGYGKCSINNFMTRSTYFSFEVGAIIQLRVDLKRLIGVLSDAWNVFVGGQEQLPTNDDDARHQIE